MQTFPPILFAAVLGAVTPALPAAEAEYPVTPATYVLLHLNGNTAVLGQDGKATATLDGDAKLVADGWHGGCLDPGPGGGLLVQTTQPFAPPYGHTTLEARVLIREYPKTRGYILDKRFQVDNPLVHNNDPQNGAVGLSLFIDNQGRIGNEITSLYYGPTHKTTFWTPDGYKVPAGRWVHIAWVNAGWPVGKFKVYVDRVPVLELTHEFHHRIFYDSEHETAGSTIAVGNSTRGDAPFPGLIDEVRILGANLDLTPPPDLSWTDPDAKRPCVRGAPFFLPDNVPHVYVACDDLEHLEAMVPDRWKATFKGGTLAPGVRGKALAGVTLDLNGPELLRGEEGTIEFWMMPENWNNKMVQNFTFLQSGTEPFFNLYVFNTVDEFRPISLYFYNDARQLVFVSFKELLDEGNWHHLVLTWKDGEYRMYRNGLLAVASRPKEIDRFVHARRANLRFPGGSEDKTTRFDEIYLYNRRLTPDEAWNAYARYRDPGQLREVSPYAAQFKTCPKLELVRAEVDFQDAPTPRDLTLNLRQQERTIATANITLPADRRQAAIQASTAAASSGPVSAELVLTGADGKPGATIRRDLPHDAYPWLGNRLGVPDTVPEPWVPVTVKDRTVRCLMQEYELENGLLGQVRVNSGSLLAAPAGFDAGINGKTVTLRAAKPRIRLQPNGLGAEIVQDFSAGGIALQATGTLDFDGFILYRLRLAAHRKPVTVDWVRLQIPVKPDQALDYYVLGEHMDHIAGPVPDAAGNVWDSLTGNMFRRHEVPEYGAMQRPRRGLTYGNFVPFAWLGGNRRGICFLADNDRGWVQSDQRSALEIVRTPRAVSLILNLIGAPTALTAAAPREIVLSLMATPSKRPAAGWRTWKTESFFTISAAGRVLASDMFYVPYPVDYAKSAAYMQGVWKKGVTPLPYMDFYGSDTRMEPAEAFRWEWWPGQTQERFRRESQVYPANYCTGSLADWYLLNFSQWVDRCGVNGLYIDNSYPSPMADTVTGPGYIHEQGGIQAGYQLLAMRDYYKRIYCLMAARKKPHPYTMIHMTHCMIAPAMSFADIAYEGEDHYINGENATQQEKGSDHIEYWPNHIVRVIDQPQTWGCGVHWLEAVRGDARKWKLPYPKEAYVRAWQTQLLLHDSGGCGAGPEAFTRFCANDPDPDFVLYRDNRAIAAAPAAGVFVSYYRRADGAVLAVIGNHNQEERRVTLTVDPAGLGLRTPQFRDPEDRGPVEPAGTHVRITVPRRDFRLLELTETGALTGVPGPAAR